MALGADSVRVVLSTRFTRSSNRTFVLSSGSGDREGMVIEIKVVLMAENNAAFKLFKDCRSHRFRDHLSD